MTPTPIVPATKPTTSERDDLEKILFYADNGSDTGMLTDYAAMANAAIAAGFRRDPGWVACSERMPEPDQHVIAGNAEWTPREMTWGSGKYLKNQACKWKMPDGRGAWVIPTHWMPLPPTPARSEAGEGT